MGRKAKILGIICILFMMYMNIRQIQFYSGTLEYTLSSIFGPLLAREPMTPQVLMLINFIVGGLAIGGTAAG